ncbi:MAG: O-antigen ligase family protein [Bacteroidales bacterium]|nr:O-antigen ligase family protein [Bacteroidales bacterium]
MKADNSIAQLRHFFVSQPMRNIQKITNGFHLIAGYLLAAALILPFRFQYHLLWIFFISYGIDFFASGRLLYWQWTRDKWWGVVMLLLWALQPLWHLFEHSHLPYFNQVMDHRLAFMAFGVMTILGFSKHFKMKHLAWVLCSSAALAVLYIIIKIGCYTFITDPERTYHFMVERITLFGSHMNFNLYLNTALVSAIYIANNSSRQALWWLLLPVTIIATALAITEGRVGMITGGTLCLIGIFVWFRAMNLEKMGRIVGGICLLIGCCYGLHHIAWVNSHFKGSDIDDNPRKYIWHVAIETGKEHPLLGQGVSDARKNFVEHGTNDTDFIEHYAQKNIFENENWNGDLYVMHPHNASIAFWLEYGVIGVALFLLLFLLAPVGIDNNNKLTTILLLGVFLLQATFEIFGSNLTPLSWGFFVTLFRNADTTPCKKTEEKTT